MTGGGRDRRHPHRPLVPEQIADFLGDRAIVSSDLLPGGKSNSNYRLLLSDGSDCVLRLLSARNGSREAHLIEMAGELVPVPKVLSADSDWIALEFIPGRPLQCNPHELLQAGEVIARLQTRRFDRAGWIEADGSVTAFDFPEGDFTATMLGRDDVRAWLGEELADATARMIEQTLHLRDGLSDPRLVHGDFNPPNIVVRDGRIAAVLDWEFAHAGTRWMDVGNLLRHAPRELWEHVRQGLEQGGATLPEDWQARAELVDLSSALEFLASGRSDDFKRRCVRRLEGLVERYSTLRWRGDN